MRDYNQVQAQDFLGHLCKQPGISGARVTINYAPVIASMFNVNKTLVLDFKEYQIGVAGVESMSPQNAAEAVAPLLLTLLTDGKPLDQYDVLSVKRGDISVNTDHITLHVSYLRDEPETDQPRATGLKADGPFSPAHINHMVERFLQWRIPQPFRPDGGISYTPLINQSTGKPFEPGPTGTNLFGANEATDMIRHMIDGMEFPAETSNIIARIGTVEITQDSVTFPRKDHCDADQLNHGFKVAVRTNDANELEVRGTLTLAFDMNVAREALEDAGEGVDAFVSAMFAEKSLEELLQEAVACLHGEFRDKTAMALQGMRLVDKAEEAKKQPGDGYWEATAMIGVEPVPNVLYGSSSMEAVQKVVEGLMYNGAASLANFTRVDIKHSTHKHSSIIYRRDDPAADPWRRSLLNVTDKTEEWIHMTMDTPVPRRKSPEAERVEAYNNTVDRLEPNIAMIDAGAAYASGAISLKRIADAQTRIADYNERMLAKLEMPTDLKNIVEALMHPNFTQANIIAMVTAYLQKRR